jgi:hypothetical protein
MTGPIVIAKSAIKSAPATGSKSPPIKAASPIVGARPAFRKAVETLFRLKHLISEREITRRGGNFYSYKADILQGMAIIPG